MGGRPRPKREVDEPQPSTSAAYVPSRDPRVNRPRAEASAPQSPEPTDLVPQEVTLPVGEVRGAKGGGKRGPPSSDEEARGHETKKICHQDDSSDESTQGSIRSSGSSETITVPRELFEKLKAYITSPTKERSQRSASFAEVAASTPSRPTSPRGDPQGAQPKMAATTTSTDANAGANAPPSTPANATGQRTHYPPIVVEKLPNWPQHLKEIAEKLEHSPNVRPFGEGVRFLPKSALEFRTIQRYITEATAKDANIHWYCYSVPQELPIKVALRGLPTSAQEEEIREALKEKGFDAVHIRRIPSVRGRPGCVFHIQIARVSRERLQELYSIKKILHMPGVSFEGWRGPGGVPQCHRCQAFGHSSHNCHRPPRCVRCAGEHIVADCPRSRTEPAKCANCGRMHAANNRHCKAYKKAARQRNIPVRPQPPQTREQQKAPRPTRADRRARQRPEEEQSPTLQPPAPVTPVAQPKKSRRGGRQVQRRRTAASARAPQPAVPPTTERQQQPQEMEVVEAVAEQQPTPTPTPQPTNVGCTACGTRPQWGTLTSYEGAQIVEMLRGLFEYMQTMTPWEDRPDIVKRVEDTFVAWQTERIAKHKAQD